MSYSTIAWIVLIGSILFLVAAFNPSARAFGARTLTPGNYHHR